MPEFISKNLGALITIIVISVGGIVSFNKQGSEIEYLKERVVKLETSQADVISLLSKIDKRLGLISCKLDSSTCLEK